MTAFEMKWSVEGSGIAPVVGGGNAQFPVSDKKGWLVRVTDLKQVAIAGNKGGRLVISIEGGEGPTNGVVVDWGFNLWHTDVEIAKKATGRFNAFLLACGIKGFNSPAELIGKICRVIVIAQPTAEYPHNTNIVDVRTQSGDDPTAANATTGGTTAQSQAFQQTTVDPNAGKVAETPANSWSPSGGGGQAANTGGGGAGWSPSGGAAGGGATTDAPSWKVG